MIKSVQDKETKRFLAGKATKFPSEILDRIARKLRMLQAAHSLEDLRIPPANQLEALSGNRKGQHSIRINKQWRVCFRWEDGHCYDVEITDYH